MNYQVNLEWQDGENKGKMTAFVHADELDEASKLAQREVGTKIGQNVHAVRCAELKRSVVFIPANSKPVFLSLDQAADARGQGRHA